MFAVTPRTSVGIGDIELDYDAQVALVKDIRTYITWEIYPYKGNRFDGISVEEMLEEIDFSKPVTKEGKLAKRISKWCKERIKLELESYHVSDLGSIIMNHMGGSFVYDITDTFDWYAGDFGDHGSCFWGGNSEAKNVLMENGGLALRFFDSEEGEGKEGGVGRCWLVPLGTNWIAFNAYGPNLDTVWARLQQILPNAKIKRVELENYGESGGLVYINNGVGLLISERATCINWVDMELGEDERRYCDDCGDEAYEDDLYWVESIEQRLCRYCYEQIMGECHWCGDRREKEALTYVTMRYRSGVWLRDDLAICESCFEDVYTCANCGYEAHGHDPHETVDGETVCGYCIKMEYTKCRECDTYNKKGEPCPCQEDADEMSDELPVAYQILERVKAAATEAGLQVEEWRVNDWMERIVAEDLEAKPYLLINKQYHHLYTASLYDMDYYKERNQRVLEEYLVVDVR